MIYIHVPFCRSFCTYCDFYSEIASEERTGRYADALCREIAERSGEITDDIPTLYIGGGTPSVLPLSVLERIVGALPPTEWTEFTLEANPEDLCEKGLPYLEGLRRLGVDRLSMGVQSFDDGMLRWMNRRHNGERAVRAFRLAREAGFRNISIDLIFGISHLADGLWEETLAKAVSLAPEHISCYQLSVEGESALGRMVAEGRYREADEEQCRRQYDRLCRVLSDAGYVHYEISNFALPGREAVHNSAYWRRVPYVGFGPGAHSFDGFRRRWNNSSLADRSFTEEVLTPEDVRVETLMLALRTAWGIESSFLHENCRPDVIDSLLDEGALAEEDGRFRIPESRFFVSDEIIRELI